MREANAFFDAPRCKHEFGNLAHILMAVVRSHDTELRLSSSFKSLFVRFTVRTANKKKGNMKLQTTK